MIRYTIVKTLQIKTKGTEPKKLTREECIDLWNNQSEKKSGFKKK